MPTVAWKNGSSMTSNAPNPKELGFIFPPEWAPHDATWFAWPHCEETWPGHLREAQTTIARSIVELTRSRKNQFLPERAELLVRNEAERDAACAMLSFWDYQPDRVGFHVIPTNDAWIRDYGPTFLVRDQVGTDDLDALAVVNWRFDGWGGKGATYYGHDDGLDDAVAETLATALEVPIFDANVVMEGGAFDHNGKGTLLTTKNCLLDRQPHKDPSHHGPSQKELEKHFETFLGISKVLWLNGVAFDGDDTDGHIDNLARFVSPTQIVTVVGNSPDDPLYAPLQENLSELNAALDQDGNPFEVISIPLPRPLYYQCTLEGAPGRWRYPASYANFYIGNDVVLVPTYGDPNDRVALNTLSECFPSRDVVGIDCSHYILGQGAIHCSTQQQPSTAQRGPALNQVA